MTWPKAIICYYLLVTPGHSTINYAGHTWSHLVTTISDNKNGRNCLNDLTQSYYSHHLPVTPGHSNINDTGHTWSPKNGPINLLWIWRLAKRVSEKRVKYLIFPVNWSLPFPASTHSCSHKTVCLDESRRFFGRISGKKKWHLGRPWPHICSGEPLLLFFCCPQTGSRLGEGKF